MADPNKRGGRKGGGTGQLRRCRPVGETEVPRCAARQSDRGTHGDRGNSHPFDVRHQRCSARPSGFRPNSSPESPPAASSGGSSTSCSELAPWGLIVCLILGFCAGMLNLMRAAGVGEIRAGMTKSGDGVPAPKAARHDQQRQRRSGSWRARSNNSRSSPSFRPSVSPIPRCS